MADDLDFRPIEKELSFVTQDSWSKDIEFRDESGVIDISDAVITLTIQDVIKSTVLAHVTASLTDPTNGIATISLSESNTDITPGRYCFDIQYVNGSTTRTMFAGPCNVVEGYS